MRASQAKETKKQEKDKPIFEQSSPDEDGGSQQMHDLDETFTSATSNLLDITSSNIPPTNKHSKHTLETYTEVNEKVTSTPVSQPTVSTPAPAPSTSPAKLNKQEEPDAGKAKVTDQSPASTGGIQSITRWITKKLNPDTAVGDVGDEMKAYYDKDLKTWIFPDMDPAEVAKPLAPPPITPVTKKGDENIKSAPNATKPVINDPLSALMAPPSRSTPASRSTPSAMSSMMAPPMRTPSIKNVPPTGTNGEKPPVTPQFVIFQPKAKEDEKK